MGDLQPLTSMPGRWRGQKQCSLAEGEPGDTHLEELVATEHAPQVTGTGKAQHTADHPVTQEERSRLLKMVNELKGKLGPAFRDPKIPGKESDIPCWVHS